MVHLSALFVAIVGSSLVSALSGSTGAVEARDADLSLGQIKVRDAMADEYIKHINIYYTQDGLKQGVVAGDFDLNTSPLPAQVTLDSLSASLISGGTTYLSINATFSGIVFPPNTTENTGRIENIKVAQDLTPILSSSLIDASATLGASLQNGSAVSLSWNQSSIPIKFTQE